MMDYWEPHTFEVGDRVIYRPSGECDSENHIMGDTGTCDGSLGVVIGVRAPNDPSSRIGHRFVVRFTPPIPIPGGGRWRASAFAAVELEPAPWEPLPWRTIKQEPYRRPMPSDRNIIRPETHLG